MFSFSSVTLVLVVIYDVFFMAILADFFETCQVFERRLLNKTI